MATVTRAAAAAAYLGAFWRRFYGGDVYAFAREEDIRIFLVPHDELIWQRPPAWPPLREGQRIAGFCRIADPAAGLPAEMWIALELGPLDRAITIAHEIAHCIRPAWGEDECEAFAFAFCDAVAHTST